MAASSIRADESDAAADDVRKPPQNDLAEEPANAEGREDRADAIHRERARSKR